MTSSNPVLPDFTRWAWAGPTERAWFAPLMQDATNAFMDLERLSVVAGLRKAAYQFVPLGDVTRMSEWAHEYGLMMVPITASRTTGYSSTAGDDSHPNSLRVVYTKPEYYADVLPFKGNQKIGELLGFPPCCRAAFDQTWGQGQVDSTYEQFKSTKAMDILRMVYNTPYSHTLLRWIGIRLVPHMPCHHYCQISQMQAESFLELGMKYGYLDEMLFMKEAMQWPIKWSRLFGIAEIVTPAVKISTRSDWTASKDAFEKKGSYLAPEAHWWTDNGYSNPETMRHAHKDIIYTIMQRIPPGGRVLDLGCGNGMLLRRLKVHRPDIRIMGIEQKADVVKRIPMLTGTWKVGNLQDTHLWEDFNADVVLMTPGRFSELSETEHITLRDALAKIPDIYFYQYADWTEPMRTYTDRANFRITPLTKTPRVEIAVVDI